MIQQRYLNKDLRNTTEQQIQQNVTEETTEMYVVKRPKYDGQVRKELVSFDKVLRRISLISKDLKNINQHEISKYVIQNIVDGITTTALDEFTASYCEQMISVEPEYDILATRIMVSNHQKNCQNNSFKDTMFMLYNNKDINGVNKPLVSRDLIDIIEDEDKWEIIRNTIDYGRDNNFDFFGFKTLYYGYLLKHKNRVIERPQDLFMRVALGIYGKVDLTSAMRLYDLLSTKRLSMPTPTLYNSGTPNNQFLSCFLAGINDSIEGMYAESLTNFARISKKSGGLGCHVHNLRPNGALIHTTGFQTTGIIPYLKVLNYAMRHVSQGGKRPGSCAVYMEMHHGDIEDFLDLRKNYGDMEKRCHDLFTAVWVSDLFMERVKNGEKWHLMSEYDCPGLSDAYGDEYKRLYEKYEQEKRWIKEVNASDLWDSLLKSQVETGTPYIAYKDAVNRKTNQQNIGTIKSSNLCIEIMQYSDPNEYACCVLSSIPLGKYVKKDLDGNLFYDYDQLGQTMRFTVRTLNRVIDINDYPVEETRRSNFKHRPLGIGVQGLHDAFFQFRFPFDSPEAYKLNEDIFECLYYNALSESMLIAKEREEAIVRGEKIFSTQYDPILREYAPGAYSSFEGSPASKGILQFDMWGEQPPSDSKYNWTELKENIKRYGLRNSLLIAVMPTASSSQICGSLVEACEPITSNIYKRSIKAGEFIIANKYMINHLKEIGLWNKTIHDKIVANDGSLAGIDEIPTEIQQIYQTAWDLSQKHIINQAAERGKYVCQGQSMNLFMRVPTPKRLTNMHFYAHQKGLKTGMYYLRTRPQIGQTKFAMNETISAEDFFNQSNLSEKRKNAQKQLACSIQNKEACEMCQG